MALVNYNSREIPKIGYTTGIIFNYQLNKRFSIETGSLFSDKGYKTDKFFFNFLFGQQQQTPYENLPNSVYINYHYYYFGIPMKLNIFLFTGKTKLYLSAGISTNLFLARQTTSIIEFNNGHISRKTSTYNEGHLPINFAALSGFGISYNLKDNFILRCEPTFKHSINSINNFIFKEYLYSFGLNTGLSYKLL